jgi:hypothetical protein
MQDSLDRLLTGLGLGSHQWESHPVARLDVDRESRKGAPEVVLADRKQPEHVLEIARVFLDARGRVLLSRLPAETAALLIERYEDHQIERFEAARGMVIRRPDHLVRSTGGVVGIVTAGTSDVPVAEEAQMVAREMGCTVVTAYDCGVAGIHRLAEPLRQFREAPVDVIIVAAGMDGALPSVVSGIVDVPVIGLPVSVGYGLGGQGLAALLSMLQTCSPGLTVVNIDNGIGAGISAALIANRVAAARRASR